MKYEISFDRGLIYAMDTTKASCRLLDCDWYKMSDVECRENEYKYN